MMNPRRLNIHLLSVLLLLIWGSILLYFYLSGRLVPHYLQPVGNFRNMVLYSGIGLIVLGIFNLATMGAEVEDCCEQGHDHNHEHHECEHGHAAESHGHHHEHGEGCCGHDAHHEHHHHHEHEHHAHEAHGHGILEESGSLGRAVAILILAVPLLIAATLTPDRPSAAWVQKKGLYTQQYGTGSGAEQFSLRRGKQPSAATPEILINTPPADDVFTGAPLADSQRTPGSAVSASPAATTTTAKAGSASAAKSFGSFTFADLKAQVPQNTVGDFMLDVPELYQTAGDSEVQKVLAGQPVITTAQVLPEKVNNGNGKRLRIFRLLIQCCAADARPYSIPVEFTETAPTLKDMTWIEFKGTMEYVQENGQTVPLLRVKSYQEAAPPEDSMLY
jgi:hypothetical protein